MQLKKWKTISSHKCCENEWISVREDKVKLPTNEILNSYIVINYPGAVGVLAVQQNKILLVQQYRYAIDKFTLEIPSGGLIGKGHDNIIKSARVELLEEAGYIAGKIEPFYSYHPSPGSSNEIIHLVRALDIEKSADVVGFDVNWYEIEDLLNLIRNNKIMHSPTIIAILIGYEQGYLEH